MSRGRNTDHDSDVEACDLAELEDQLYAQVHYRCGDEDAGPSDIVENHAPPQETIRSVSNYSIISNLSASKNNGPSKSKGRYWTVDNRGNETVARPSKPNHKRFGQNANGNNALRDASVGGDNDNQTNNDPNVPPGKQPRPFTPYTPLLSESGSTSPTIDVASTSNSNPVANAKRPNDKEKKRKNKSDDAKCINPFNKLHEQRKKQRDKIESKKARSHKARQGAIAAKAVTPAIAVDEPPTSDEDDVVIIPTAPPPLICIDDSDDDVEIAKVTAPTVAHQFTSPGTKSTKNHSSIQPYSSRGPSPTLSVVSDDFIGHNDRRRIDLDTFGGIPDEELVSITSFNGIVQINENGVTSEIIDSNVDNDDTANIATVFAEPAKSCKRLNPFSKKKSYVVSENSFAAVDVYESESSDMPDTVYAKGKQARQRNPSSSDTDIHLIEISPPKSKRLHKRKSSGSNKGSDYNPEVSSSEEDDDNDTDEITASQEVRNSHPYLVRGEALGKVKKMDKRNKKSKQRTTSNKGDKTSDEEFLNKITSICNDGDANDEEIEEDLESSRESIDAREIVQSVLQRRKKKLKVPENSTAQAASNAEWFVKDQIGETDDVTFLNVKESLFAVDNGSTNIPAASTEVPLTIESEKSTENSQMNVPEEDTSGENSVKSNPSAVHPEIGWNEEMSCFYNKSWGGETFSTKHIQHNLPRTFGEWAIGAADKYLTPSLLKNKYGNKPIGRCTNCRERGHRVTHCPTPPLPPRCYMCGEAGHLEPRCPNTKCLSCGRNTKTFVYGCSGCYRSQDMQCHLCRGRGHRAADCPDKWRRYHSTTVPNTALNRHENPLPIKPKYCSVCSHKGHVAEHCKNAVRIFQYPMNSVFVKNYEESYRRTFDNGSEIHEMDYSMFYTPKKNYQFNYEDAVDAKGDTLYGRFAKAVRLDKIQKAIKNQYRNEEREERKRKRQIATGGEASVAAKFRKIEEPSVSNQKKEELPKNAPVEDNDIDMSQENSEPVRIEITETISKNKSDERKAPVQSNERPIEMETKKDKIATMAQAEVVAENSAKVQTKVLNEANLNTKPENVQIDMDEVQSAEQGLEEYNLNDNKEDSSGGPLTKLGSFEAKMATDLAPNKSSVKKSSKTTKLRSQAETTNDTITPGTSSNTKIRRKLAEYQSLTREEKRLERMRESLILSEPTADETEEDEDDDASDQDKDSNYDFSEFYGSKIKRAKKFDSSTSSRSEQSDTEKLPEYIPLDTPGPSSLILTRSTTPAPLIVNESRCDATVFLTKEYTKFLLTVAGNNFLRHVSNKYDVVVRMEWRSFGNVLMVNGTSSKQEKFHADLIEYCKSSEIKLRSRCEMGIPKNRQTLIKFIIETINQLDKPLGNVSDLFERTKRCERYNTKGANKQAERYRREINMLLMGQIGLRDGRFHLTSLQQNLRDLLASTDEIINANIRKDINEHINYIFSPVDHGNYVDLIDQYKTLKRSRNLPILNLDRKLLGLSINTRVESDRRTPNKNERSDREMAGQSDDSILENSRKEEYSLTENVAEIPGKECVRSSGDQIGSPKKSAASDVQTMKQESRVNIPMIPAYESDGDDLDKIDEKYITNPTKPSSYWSNKCKNLVAEWSIVPDIKSNELVMTRLSKIKVKADKNNISYNDYKVLNKIFENLISSVNKPQFTEGSVLVFPNADETKKK